MIVFERVSSVYLNSSSEKREVRVGDTTGRGTGNQVCAQYPVAPPNHKKKVKQLPIGDPHSKNWSVIVHKGIDFQNLKLT